ncbi:MAG: hypothetical protein PVJ15_06745 [Gammaproteobacteria bacterium]|jgi:hypothetical protein
MTRYRLLSTPRSFLFTAGDSRPVSGIRLGFDNITYCREDPCECPSNCYLDVTDISTRQVSFTLINREPDNCCITEIYFNDGDLLSITVQVVMDTDASEDPSHIRLSPSGKHESTPRPYHDSTTFQAVRSRPEAAESEAMLDGICRNESLGIVFDLQPGISFADIISALSRGKLNIGINVQDTETGGSRLFINTPQLSLSPASPRDCTKGFHPAGPETEIPD